MGAFENAYNQLNAEQKLAVDTIDGPVLVVAGPGTGKTQLLSMRVANILRKTDIEASNILCLTFTNKAAINMRERLIQLTDGEARNVMVKTFHSFAAELMNMYPDHFWNGARLSTAPDAVQSEIIQTILSQLPLDNPLALTFAGSFTASGDVKNGLRLAKEAGLTPDKLEALLKANLAYIDLIEPQLVDILSRPLSAKYLPELQTKIDKLPEQGIDKALAPLVSLSQVIQNDLRFAIQQDEGTNKTTHTGKWKQRFIQSVGGVKGMHKERERNLWWLALAGVYRSYRQELHSRGYYDYSDMIVEVISVLEANPDMRADAQEQFQYVLIDEFQDTNAAQLRLAHLIADHVANAGNPNLMAVGDDDQSIYKFNGAELSNMLSFTKSYPNTKLIVLEDNYRSSQAILDAAAKIIDQAADRLVTRSAAITKNLKAKNSPGTGDIIHASYPSQEHQLSMVADQIAKQHLNGNYSIAVLARSNQSLRRLSSILLRHNVPVAYQEQSNVLEHQVVLQTYYLASLLLAIQKGDQENTNYLLSQILRHPMWQLSPQTLWQLATDNRRGKSWLDYMLKSDNEALRSIAEWLLWLAQESSHENLTITLEYIIGLRPGQHLTSPLRDYFVSKTTITTDYMHALSALRLLLSLVNEFARLSSGTLEDFVAFIKLNIETEVVIADESVFVSGQNAVELLTVHKAKGLEFDTVYVIDVVDSSWRPSSRGRRAPANLPLQPAFDDTDDYVRLMYVAATRAKRSLIATSFRQDERGRDVMASPLIHPALKLREVDTKDASPAIETLEEHILWPSLPSTDERSLLKPILDSYSLSPTALLDFLDITKGGPEYFLERHILSLPGPRTANMAFGTAIHAALELAQVQTNQDTFSLEAILRQFDASLTAQYLPASDYVRYKDHGTELLKKLLASDSFWLPRGGLPEQAVTDVRLGQARINGKIDRLDKKDKTIRIVDYKTGKPLSSFTTRDQTKALKAWRHRMQLTFYALMVKESGRFGAHTDITGLMIYVEATEPKELVREFIPSAEDLVRMQQIIEAVWPKITTLNLPDITNYEASMSGINKFEQDLIDRVI